MGRIFFRGTGDSDYAFGSMLKIIERGGIKSLIVQNSSFRCLVNGKNYISICSWDDDIDHRVEKMQSAFNGWIFGCPCFVIKDVEAIKCGEYHSDYNSEVERVSQYNDEWHVKDFILLDKIIGITLPFKDGEFMNRNKEEVGKISMYAGEYNLQIFEGDETLIEDTNRFGRGR